MMDLSLKFRRLVLKHIPQLTHSDLDKYESLIALYQYHRFAQDMEYTNESEEHGVDISQSVYEEAQSILAPVKHQYKMVRSQWYARREYAFVQDHFQQIPVTIERLVRFIRVSTKYHWINFYTTVYLSVYKVLYYLHLIKPVPMKESDKLEPEGIIVE